MLRTPDDGAESQIRTGDTAIFSRVLYQLSYLGPVDPGPIGPVGVPQDTTGLRQRQPRRATRTRRRTRVQRPTAEPGQRGDVPLASGGSPGQRRAAG